MLQNAALKNVNVVVTGQIEATGGEDWLPENVVYSLGSEDYSFLFSVDLITANITYLESDLTSLPPGGFVTLLIEATEVVNSNRTSVVPLYLTYEDGGDPPIVMPALQEIPLPFGYSRKDPCATISSSSLLPTSYTWVERYPEEVIRLDSYFELDENGTFVCNQLSPITNQELPLTVTYVVEAVNEDGADKATVIFLLEDDDPPVFSSDIYDEVELESGYITNTCYSVMAESEGSSTVEYNITQVSPEEYSTKFTLDSSSGIFTCHELDHPTLMSERVIVAVTATNEGGSDSATVVFTLERKGEACLSTPPVFDSDIYDDDEDLELEYGYNSTNSCFTVKADSKGNSPVEYSITDVSPPMYNSTFRIDNTTGDIACLELLYPKLELERVSVAVTATNECGSDLTNVIFILKNIEASSPKFLQDISHRNLSTALFTRQCYKVFAMNATGYANYTIEGVDPVEYTNFFTIDNTGVICEEILWEVKEPVVVTVLIKITTYFGSDSQVILFNVYPPEQTSPFFSQDIYEAEQVLYSNATFSQCEIVNAGDFGIHITYALEEVHPKDYYDYFVIGTYSGVIDCLFEETNLTDLTPTDSVTLTIRATNENGTDVTAVVFNIQPHIIGGGIADVIPPAFEESIYLAGYMGGQPCFRLSVDEDAEWATHYTITDVSPSFYADYFTIDDSAGVISCKSLSGTELRKKETVTVVVEASNLVGFDKTTVIFRLLEDYEFDASLCTTTMGTTTTDSSENNDRILLLVFGGVGAFVCLAALALLAFIAFQGCKSKPNYYDEKDKESHEGFKPLVEILSHEDESVDLPSYKYESDPSSSIDESSSHSSNNEQREVITTSHDGNDDKCDTIGQQDADSSDDEYLRFQNIMEGAAGKPRRKVSFQEGATVIMSNDAVSDTDSDSSDGESSSLDGQIGSELHFEQREDSETSADA